MADIWDDMNDALAVVRVMALATQTPDGSKDAGYADQMDATVETIYPWLEQLRQLERVVTILTPGECEAPAVPALYEEVRHSLMGALNLANQFILWLATEAGKTNGLKEPVPAGMLLDVFLKGAIDARILGEQA